jgi:hypothetical protein
MHPDTKQPTARYSLFSLLNASLGKWIEYSVFIIVKVFGLKENPSS